MSRPLSTRDDVRRLIDAGGIVDHAIVDGTASGDAVDVITARTCGHSGLDGRVVVRLVPEGLGPAEDLTMEFLGFHPGSPPVAVGWGRRQALGFPAWAVINDPVNGHHALALVQDLERLARTALSKPGNAKEGFEHLASRLARAVPHFLPTFFEQAGRAFLAADNKPAAAVMFGRAREAERVHALTVDEDRQRDVFLEFAFCGALTAKSLTQHAKDLAARAEPGDAYELFLRICLERVAGGLPPYAGMAEDLRRLAKASGLPLAEQDERVISSLLGSPSLARAPLAFWKAYRPALVRLAERDIEVRAALLDLLPASEQDGVEELWFEVLEASGAVAGLVEVSDRPDLARPRGGAAGWLSRAALWRSRGWRSAGRSELLLGLVERMAPRLRAEGQALHLAARRLGQLDVDLLDLCLAHGLQIADPQELRIIPLHQWLRDSAPGRRDLVALARTEWAREPLSSGMHGALQSRHSRSPDQRLTLDQVQPLLDCGGARQILARWLRTLAEEAERSALPGLEEALDRLAPAALDAVLAVDVDAARRLAGVDAGRALARTLRIGLLDELGWPALETALLAFPVEQPTAKKPRWMLDNVSLADAWPALCLVNRARVVVVDRDAELLRHDVRVPPSRPFRGWAQVEAVYVDGQVLVCWPSPEGAAAYWSGLAAEVFDVPEDWVRRRRSRAWTLPLPGGGRTGGGRPVLPGDRTFAEIRPVASDGTSWWRCDDRGWREYDPVTGSGGRLSRPDFFERALARDADATLLDVACRLAPVPAGLERSPLGVAGGMLGWRAVSLPDGSRLGEGVDGSVLRLSADHLRSLPSAVPVGSLQLPGAGPRIGVVSYGGRLALWDGDVVGSRLKVAQTEDEPYARGTPLVPPLDWWHALRPRDEKGSAQLRACTDDQGRALLAAAGQGAAAVRQVLSRITDPRLTAGVAGVLEVAVACAQRAAALPAPATIAPAVTRTAAGVSDRLLASALSGLSNPSGTFHGYRHYGVVSGFTAFDAMRAAVELGAPAKRGLRARLGLARDTPPESAFPSTQAAWPLVVGGLGALALRAATVATPQDERSALLALLEVVLTTPLVESDGRWREVTLRAKAGMDVEVGTVVRTAGGSAVILAEQQQHWQQGAYVKVVIALEHSPAGRFGAVPGYTVEASRTSSGWGGADRLRALLELVRTRGPAPWRPEAVDALVAATGLTRAEAALLLAGLPRTGSYEHNFLPKHTRDTLGLKVAEAVTAQPALAALPPSTRMLLCGVAMPADPAHLWDRGPDVDAVAATWVRSFGRRVPVPESLVAELTPALKHLRRPVASLLQDVAAPTRCAWLMTDRRWSLEGWQLTSSGDEEGFDGPSLVAGTSALLWLAYRLGLDDPLRATLPQVYGLLRERLGNPSLLIGPLNGHSASGLRRLYGLPRLSGHPDHSRSRRSLSVRRGCSSATTGDSCCSSGRPGSRGPTIRF